MYEARRPEPLFLREVSNFVERATQHAEREGTTDIYCPCVDCKNEKLWPDGAVIKSHLVRRGFVEGYTRWTYHGEEPTQVAEPTKVDVALDEPYEVDGPVEVEEDVGGGESSEEGDLGAEAMDMEDDFDVEELLCHIEPQVLLGAGTMSYIILMLYVGDFGLVMMHISAL